MTHKTDYYELNNTYKLPLAEALCLAHYNYFIDEDPGDLKMVEALRKKIREYYSDSLTKGGAGVEVCHEFMIASGYLDYEIPGLYQPICDFYRNYDKPEFQRVKNDYDYLQLYTNGQVTLVEAYVLAKNKNFLLYDSSMLPMIFEIEDLIFDEIIKSGRFQTAAAEIAEYQSQLPRKQISGRSSTSVQWFIRLYMNSHNYTYDGTAANSFRPMKNKSGV